MKNGHLSRINTLLTLILVLYFQGYTNNLHIHSDSTQIANIKSALETYVNSTAFIQFTGYKKRYDTSIDSIQLHAQNKEIRIFFDKQFAYTPIRTDVTTRFNQYLSTILNDTLKTYHINYYTDNTNLKQLIPNYYQNKKRDFDKQRMTPKNYESKNVVQNISKPWLQKSQLSDQNIALWHSHGWYYESKLNRWEWQRARLFGTVEDLLPMSFTINYLVPMLENAGANVFLPRERDWQINEVIVDNNKSTGKSELKTHISIQKIDTGFAIGNPPYISENPFTLGTALSFSAEKKGQVAITYIPEIPESGYYPVYISYKTCNNSANEVLYKVYHTGGVTDFMVNQQMGSSTWIYLGKFKFKKGLNPEIGKVEIWSSSKKPGQMISADAVRFGAGMGNISRNGMTSKRPRYQEGARYYLQYAGMPDTLVWHLNSNTVDDYSDDYQSRGEWIDYLMGAPSGPAKNRNVKGLGIPISLSLAFHTDAGVTDNDTVIGTLGIYSTKKDTAIFPNGISKMTSRDLTDIIQTQIVSDIRKQYDPAWTHRGLRNRGYSEAFRPMTPAMLLELLSHQNFLDSRFEHEPKFQFDVSRAIYKGMVKFLATMHNAKYVIQPLPVTHFTTAITPDNNICLTWQAQTDTLEPTAAPEGYIVYRKIDNQGFDNGIYVKHPEFTLENPEKDKIYSFKITAYNKGGESLPSEELSVCINSENVSQILIVNAFDRLGTPAWFNDVNFGGYLEQVDEGVPYMYDFHTVGHQYDFNKKSPWLDDDSPGFGASSADLENQIIAGNTFNFSYIHGKAIKNAGYSFASVSDEVFEQESFKTDNYIIIDVLAGEEKTSYFPKNDSVKQYQLCTKAFIQKLDTYLNHGGNLFISGAHIATDFHQNQQDSVLSNLLKIKWRTSNASKMGNFYFMDTAFAKPDITFRFNTDYSPTIYRVEGADALEPADSTAQTIIRYNENNMSAGVAYKDTYGLVTFGFPFETILNENQRNHIMKKVIQYLQKQ